MPARRCRSAPSVGYSVQLHGSSRSAWAGQFFFSFGDLPHCDGPPPAQCPCPDAHDNSTTLFAPLGNAFWMLCGWPLLQMTAPVYPRNGNSQLHTGPSSFTPRFPAFSSHSLSVGSGSWNSCYSLSVRNVSSLVCRWVTWQMSRGSTAVAGLAERSHFAPRCSVSST